MESSELKEKWMCDKVTSYEEQEKKRKKDKEKSESLDKYNPLRDNN